MAVIDHLDLATKHIYLAGGVREFHPVDDIYKEIRTLRRTNESYRGNHMPVVASGNVAKGGGKFTPRLATFNCGWKIVPEDISHILYVSGEQITDTGEAGPACFDLEPLSSSSKVIIQYEPPLAEIIETGVSGLTQEESNQLAAVSELQYQVGEVQYQVATAQDVIDFIKRVEWGRWKIENNQMIFYGDDGITPIRIFNLKNKQGQPAERDVYERVPV